MANKPKRRGRVQVKAHSRSLPKNVARKVTKKPTVRKVTKKPIVKKVVKKVKKPIVKKVVKKVKKPIKKVVEHKFYDPRISEEDCEIIDKHQKVVKRYTKNVKREKQLRKNFLKESKSRDAKTLKNVKNRKIERKTTKLPKYKKVSGKHKDDRKKNLILYGRVRNKLIKDDNEIKRKEALYKKNQAENERRSKARKEGEKWALNYHKNNKEKIADWERRFPERAALNRKNKT